MWKNLTQKMEPRPYYRALLRGALVEIAFVMAAFSFVALVRGISPFWWPSIMVLLALIIGPLMGLGVPALMPEMLYLLLLSFGLMASGLFIRKKYALALFWVGFFLYGFAGLLGLGTGT
ncbi:MAG: hypothetical protein LBS89_08920 [Zoogloeaceae bacterium]|jgi:hypothetical protein|nr:hypothetical protein [Zoogloeaceae bacterium]